MGASGSSTAGDLWCWGGGSFGQLGDGLSTSIPRATPVLVLIPYEAAVTSASLCATGGCALVQTNQSVYCWGEGSYGQLGDACSVTKSECRSRNIPVLVEENDDFFGPFVGIEVSVSRCA